MPRCVALLTSPSLIGRAGAGPQLYQRAVAGAVARDIEAQARVDIPDRAVGAERPLLIGAAVAVEQNDAVAGGRAERRVQTLAEHPDRIAGHGPALIGLARAVPDDRLGAIGRSAHRIVQAPARRRADQR